MLPSPAAGATSRSTIHTEPGVPVKDCPGGNAFPGWRRVDAATVCERKRRKRFRMYGGLYSIGRALRAISIVAW